MFVSLHVYSIILAKPTEVHSHREHNNADTLFFFSFLASGKRTCSRKVGRLLSVLSARVDL